MRGKGEGWSQGDDQSWRGRRHAGMKTIGCHANVDSDRFVEAVANVAGNAVDASPVPKRFERVSSASEDPPVMDRHARRCATPGSARRMGVPAVFGYGDPAFRSTPESPPLAG